MPGQKRHVVFVHMHGLRGWGILKCGEKVVTLQSQSIKGCLEMTVYPDITLTSDPAVVNVGEKSAPVVRNWGVLENWKSTASLSELL